jgi:hypothetical protein
MSLQEMLLAVLLLGIVAAGLLLSTEIAKESDSFWTSMVKPPGANEDVQDVLSLLTREIIFARDWEERCRIEKYVNNHYPVDFSAPQSVQDRQSEQNNKEWNRLYEEFEARICEEYKIPLWQFYQILDEGLKNNWQKALEPCDA